MLASEVATLAQQWAGEQNVGQRWSNDQWLRAVDRAQKTLVRELKWPPARFAFMTTPGVQEYQLQEVIKIIQVYVNGQILPHTTMDIMEGKQIMVDDQSGQVGGPIGLVSPVQAPDISNSPNGPGWTSAAAASYSATNGFSGGGVTLSASPWFTGQRPMHYTNGGNLGLVPAPLTAYAVICRVVRQPVTLQTLQDAMVLPDVCMDELAWDVCEQFYYFDRDQSGASDNRTYAHQMKMTAMQACKDWRRAYEGGNDGPIPITYRGFYTGGQNRVGNA